MPALLNRSDYLNRNKHIIARLDYWHQRTPHPLPELDDLAFFEIDYSPIELSDDEAPAQ